MDYTQSDSYTTHIGTGHRMHDDAKPVTTGWSAKDANSLMWSLMEFVIDAGLVPKQFNPDDATTYRVLRSSMAALFGAGRVLAIRRFTPANTGTAWAKTSSSSGLTLVFMTGPGGGGGGVGAASSTQWAIAGGGGAGAFGVAWADASVFDGQLMTIPAGGAGGTSASDGSNGATASFGSVLSCPGGRGGTAGPVAATAGGNYLSSGGPVSSVPVGFNLIAFAGACGFDGITNSSAVRSGAGANSVVGSGGGRQSFAPGSDASGFGAGGGGAAAANSPAAAGGAGAPAAIWTLEFSK